MEKTNPFPDYPVVRLQDDAREVQKNTILTAAIEESRARIARYVQQWAGGGQAVEPLVVRVQGDYGTGKTHLLMDAAAGVEEALSESFPDTTVVKVPCMEADAVEWFRSIIGPALRRPFVKNSVVRLYAMAGRDVSQAAELTASAAAGLESDYRRIFKLVKEDVLNTSAVEERFQQLLSEVCSEASAEVRVALSGLVWDNTEKAALAWLTGEEISQADAEKLPGLPRVISSEGDAAGVMVALAAVQSYVGNPFGLMIDELEHLTRFDRSSRGGRRNLTWLKRVIEGLGAHRALIYVSGHDTAWGPSGDLFDRFPHHKPITLRKLTGADVANLVHARIPGLLPDAFGQPQADAVAALANGNMRRVLSMCRVLFRRTDGMSRPMTEEDVQQVAEETGQRIPLEEAEQRVRGMLERLGLMVVADGAVDQGRKIRFDLVGHAGDQARIAVDLKHASNQRLLIDKGRRFIERMKEANVSQPALVGCFIADGNVDDELLAIMRSERRFKVLCYDLTQRDALGVIEQELTAQLGGAGEPSQAADRLKELQAETEDIQVKIDAAQRDNNEALINQLRQQREVLEQQVGELRTEMGTNSAEIERALTNLEERRKAELEDLYARLEQLSRQLVSRRDAEIVAPQTEEVSAKLLTTYADLTKAPPFSTKLRLSMSNPLAGLYVFLTLMGMVLLFMAQGIADFVYPASEFSDFRDEYSRTKYLLLALALGLTFYGLFWLWRRFSRTEAFLEYSTGLLREVYLQSPDPKALVKVSNILRDSFEEGGPFFGKRNANKRLAKEFPEFFAYLEEGSVAGPPPPPPQRDAGDEDKPTIKIAVR